MLKRLLATTAVALSFSLSAQAAPIIYTTSGAPVDIPGLTGFMTTGAMMDGLGVTACFSNGSCSPTLLWADSGPQSGGVTGNGWSLSLNGDTFSSNWVFTFDPNNTLGQLVSLLLDGGTGFTIFDRTLPSQGTPGSASGLDFITAAGGTVNVDYRGPTGIAGAGPVGDLFQAVFIDFGTAGPRIDFTFMQDTDNDIRITQVSEPGSLALLGIAVLGLALARRRRS